MAAFLSIRLSTYIYTKRYAVASMFQSPIHHEKKKHRRHHTTAGLRHSISESSLVTMEDSAVLKTVDDLAKSILHYGSSRVSK